MLNRFSFFKRKINILNVNTMLKKHNINRTNIPVMHNLKYNKIYEFEKQEGEKETSNGVVSVSTGIFTGRSPKDKYFVEQEPSTNNLWWGDVNKPMDLKTFDKLHQKVLNHYNENADVIYICDAYAGANKKTAKKVRFITEYAWQHHFVRNMFIRPDDDEDYNDFDPDFTIINGCNVINEDWEDDKLNSEVFVGFNVEDKLAIIGGTHYGGEMKKGIFSMMNYWLPLENIMSMHCSANVGKDGDSALFFGLSGTGKTTLSVDSERELIGDDQHGWDDDGVYNFEGGCYAKTSNLSRENEPMIYDAIKRDALLENVFLKENNEVDYFNTSITENGRVSYPIHHIDNYKKDLKAGHPENIFFLTCDAFGILPPISELTHEQALYYFLSGYTAKVAGTERGVTEPQATFSACFGAAFLTLHPTKYADLLKEKLKKHNTNVYLVNTGWSGGSYGVGERMSIKTTQSCIESVFTGEIKEVEKVEDNYFGFQVPTKLSKVDENICQPSLSWTWFHDYDATAQKLVGMFKENYTQFLDPNMTDYSVYGPK